MDPQAQHQLRTKKKKEIQDAKGHGRGKAIKKQPAAKNGKGKGSKAREPKASPKRKSKAAKDPKKAATPKRAMKSVPVGCDDEPRQLGCPTCRWSKGGCHICRRPGYKSRKPRPSTAD